MKFELQYYVVPLPHNHCELMFGMTQNLLKSAVWNIEGLTQDKINDSYFQEIISEFQLLSFVETWTNDDNLQINIPGFQFIAGSNRKRHKKARRSSGGINIFVQNSIAKGIKRLPKSHHDILWIKLDSSFFNVNQDIYLATVYISPENSSYYTNGIEPIYEQLLLDITKYSSLGHIMVQGDFNAYTNRKQDYVPYDDSSDINLEDDHYVFDHILPRNNLDTKLINNSGKLLLNLCKESSLRILNGRTIGDFTGKFTCITYNGCSVVDYMLVSTDLLDLVGYFDVHNFTSLSNHCIISCSLLLGFNTQNNSKCQLDPLPNKFIWNQEAINSYIQNSNSSESRNKFDTFLNSTFTDPNDAVNSLNSILQENAAKSAKLIKRVPIFKNKRKAKPKRKPWFGDSCQDLYNTVKNYEKLVNKNPENHEYRHKFYSFRSKLRRRCKFEEKQYKERICSELSNMNDKNPKAFWDTLNKFDKLKNGKSNFDDNIPKEEFKKFYENLNSCDKKHNNYQNDIIEEYSNLKNRLDNSERNDSDSFNKDISTEEILEAIRLLKNGKSASADLISNEMLKNATHIILQPLQKLFNLIFRTGSFPKIWNESFLVLLHKKGNKFDPGNYRGISISSNMGKLFNKIIYKRLLRFINNNNLISKNQIGFKEKSRTTDHIFTLKTIIDKYKKKNKKVFAAFIDLKKAFDTVWRLGLFYKLLNNNVPKQIFNVIESMYTNTSYKIKFKDGLSSIFPSERGVKQGDVLSPLLFNFFVNNIVDTLNHNNNDPIVIGDTTISILLYADDIVLLSQSKDGLQKSLDVLYDFCSTWKLQVNTDKSKILVFNSNGKTFINQFRYDNSYLETVKQYCYLGIILKFNGCFNSAIDSLMEKARKAYFKIKKTLGINNPCKLLEKLFDTLVTPILLYGSEVWGVDSKFKDSDPFEKLHIKFIKEILGVHCKASNDGCRAELNRLPLKNKILFSIFNFLNHIFESDNTLIKDVYLKSREDNPWVKKTNSILDNLGFSYVLDNTHCFKSYLSQIRQRINDQLLQNQNAKIFDSQKLKFFQSVYKMGQRPSYVDILKNREDRAAICKIRISAHSLQIEKGRYLNIPQNERYCKLCNSNQIEDESHFLLNCKSFENQRIVFDNKLLNIIEHKNTFNRMSFILNSNSYYILKLTSTFINDCMNIRKSLL